MVTVGLTGILGSGKSTVLGFFRDYGAAVASCDAWVRRELETNAALKKRLVKSFGPAVVRGGRLDRFALARLAFTDKKKVERLNALLHPLVARRLKAFFRKHGARRAVVVEVPLLFETEFYKKFDVTIGIATDPAAVRGRLRRAGHLSPDDARRRMRWQLPAKEKIARCDFIIDNNGTKAQTRKRVKNLMEEDLWKN